MRRFLSTTARTSVATMTRRTLSTGRSAVVERYQAGLEEPLSVTAKDGYGYYPGKLGSSLGPANMPDRYTIVRKLGWGAHANVWLVRDNERDGSLVALKILTAHASTTEMLPMEELDFLLRVTVGREPPHRPKAPNDVAAIRARTTTSPGWKHCLHIRPEIGFDVESTHGTHGCMVTDALGPPLSSLLGRRRALPIETVKDVTRQLLLALDYIHSTCGIIHSDIKPQNVLLHLNRASLGSLVQTGGKETSTGEPISQPILTPELSSLNGLKVCLADLGAGNWVDKITHDSIGSVALIPPEVILGYPRITTGVDIWAFGCTVFELLVVRALFRFRMDPSLSNVDPNTADMMHLAWMMNYTGQEFPEEMFQLGRRSKELLIDPGKIRLEHYIPRQSLTDVLRSLWQGVMREEEVEGAGRFIERCLQLDPTKRASAKELLSDPWLSASASSS